MVEVDLDSFFSLLSFFPTGPAAFFLAVKSPTAHGERLLSSPSDFFLFHCWRSCLLNALWSSREELVGLCSAWCCCKEQKSVRISWIHWLWKVPWGMLVGLFWMKSYPQSNWIKEKKSWIFRRNRLFMFTHSILLQNKGCWTLSNYLTCQLLRILLHTHVYVYLTLNKPSQDLYEKRGPCCCFSRWNTRKTGYSSNHCSCHRAVLKLQGWEMLQSPRSHSGYASPSSSLLSFSRWPHSISLVTLAWWQGAGDEAGFKEAGRRHQCESLLSDHFCPPRDEPGGPQLVQQVGAWGARRVVLV